MRKCVILLLFFFSVTWLNAIEMTIKYRDGTSGVLQLVIQKKQKIDTINIAYNKIRNIPIDEDMDMLVIAVGNPVKYINKNIITGTGSIYHLLPELYRQYVQ